MKTSISLSLKAICFNFSLMIGACVTTPNPQPSPLVSISPTVMPTSSSSAIQPSQIPSASPSISPSPNPSPTYSDPYPDLPQTPTYPVEVVAGNGQKGSQDGPALQASFQRFGKPCVDHKDGTMYIPDLNKLRKLSTDGQVTTLAGSDEKGYKDGIGSEARFDLVYSCTVEPQGNVLLTDLRNERIRKVTPKGEVTTFLGTGEEKFQDGDVTQAAFHSLLDILSLPSGELYITDWFKLRLFQDNQLVTLNKKQVEDSTWHSYTRGPIESSPNLFGQSIYITVDPQKNIYTVDSNTTRVQKIDLSGMVSPLNDPLYPKQHGDYFHTPKAIAYDPSRLVLWAIAGNDHLYQIDADGKIKAVFVNRPDLVTHNPPIESIDRGSLTMGADHNLYFTSDITYQLFRIILPKP